MGSFAVVTAFALLVIAGFVKEISKTPTAARSAALIATAHHSTHLATRHATSSPSPRPKPSPSASPFPSPSPAPGPAQIADTSSGLSYQLLPSPWQPGCPSVLDTPAFNWTAGESAVAGKATIEGTVVDWHGNACSGQLSQDFGYGGPGDLESVTMSVAGALESSFYFGLQDYPALEGSSAMQVSGHPAWAVTFLVTYPDAAGEGLAWSTEAGAAVVVDRGPNQVPAVFYASVPDDLGTSNVSTLLGSLQLSPG